MPISQSRVLDLVGGDLHRAAHIMHMHQGVAAFASLLDHLGASAFALSEEDWAIVFETEHAVVAGATVTPSGDPVPPDMPVEPVRAMLDVWDAIRRFYKVAGDTPPPPSVLRMVKETEETDG